MRHQRVEHNFHFAGHSDSKTVPQFLVRNDLAASILCFDAVFLDDKTLPPVSLYFDEVDLGTGLREYIAALEAFRRPIAL